MKKAEEMCRIEYDDYRPDNIFMERQVDMKWTIFMMKKYAREAIKADRENVAKEVKVQSINHDYYVIDTDDLLYADESVYGYQVDKESIINAPEIELL